MPQAGNRQLGVLAKKLVGCYAMSSSIVDAGAAAINGVSACQILGNPPTDCRKESLSCLKVWAKQLRNVQTAKMLLLVPFDSPCMSLA